MQRDETYRALVLQMLEQGHTPREIADGTGRSRQRVYQLIRQLGVLRRWKSVYSGPITPAPVTNTPANDPA
jgi:DNA invertase Pin-like site-specific DNA recombinase